MTDNPIPTSEDAINFLQVIKDGFTKKNHLSPQYPIDYDSEVQEKVFSHVFYKWLGNPPLKFQKALQYLSDKGLAGEFPERTKIEIARCVALVFVSYSTYSTHPEWLKRTRKSTGKEALASVNNLLALFDGELQMERYADSSKLRELLQQLKGEITGEIPTTYPTSKNSDFLGMQLVKDMYYVIQDLIGDASPPIVFRLVSIIHKVPKLQVRRYITQIKSNQ